MVELLAEAYLQQRGKLEDGEEEYELNNVQIWIEDERPKTNVERMLFEWVDQIRYSTGANASLILESADSGRKTAYSSEFRSSSSPIWGTGGFSVFSNGLTNTDKLNSPLN